MVHASPVLAGLKPSALLSFSRDDYPQLPLLAQRYSAAFRQQGLVFEIVCRCKRHFLLLVYRPILLERRLDEPEVSHCLSRFGYPASGFPAKMKHLRRRCASHAAFLMRLACFLAIRPVTCLPFLENFPGPANCAVIGRSISTKRKPDVSSPATIAAGTHTVPPTAWANRFHSCWSFRFRQHNDPTGSASPCVSFSRINIDRRILR